MQGSDRKVPHRTECIFTARTVVYEDCLQDYYSRKKRCSICVQQRTYKTKDFYMGRTLDYEFSYGEQITITPRNYEFDFRFAGKIKSHYALIGMAFVAGGYPLYYDAVNEKGLGMAGLNFVGNAAYEEALPEDETEVSQVAQFEFIPWILTQCATVAEAREKLAE